ncbi:hypothetical protein BDBG_07304 [Blastomyces gilchristii SLH14081]|uniref:Uncharacterized protein n=1 Tax=Blastomyces gilchristii (strain SLH14081) TaxID=559298 RepID=A0A179UXN6_BLAGS|nr:uncharacterized protein BDBG_07304 [Blastomyces gilchristii SLH14081]OAT11888.1 hypothetical protein BDBG_07304 [Blastomyces gilchristii SLH14081]
MAATQFYLNISLDTEEDDEILEKAKELDNELQESQVEIDSQWTPYMVKMIQGHPTDRLIVFRPQTSNKVLGCIRVYKAGTTTKIWDVYDTNGTFIGKVPKNCAFEAMLVEVKLITQKDNRS